MIHKTNAIDTPWEKLRYHPVHAQLWRYRGRFAAIVAGRQSGKTELCMRKLILELPVKKPWPDPYYYYILPTFQQARRVAWYRFIRMIPKKWILGEPNKQEGCITTIFGSRLYILGADKPHRIEGNPADWVMIDESSDQRPGLFGTTIMPMLGMRHGSCYRLGVPKRNGIGKLEFKSYFEKGLNGEDGVKSFHWKSAEVMTPEEIAIHKTQITELEFAEQYEATWLDQGGSVYYAFTNANVRDGVDYDPTQEIIVGCDFNVDPMCWVLGHYKDGKLYIFDEVVLRNANTQSTIDYLVNQYYNHNAGWRFFGDASSRARHTSAVRSDYLAIKNDARLGHKKVFFPRKNPHVRDRIEAVNRGFRTADGQNRIFISYRCKKLINDLNVVAYQELSTDLEDYHGTDIGHISDALGYIVHMLMPIRLNLTAVPGIYAEWSAA